MDEKVDLVSYICDGTSNTFSDSLFDGSEFGCATTGIPAMESMETLPGDWMTENTPQDLNLLSENFNLGEFSLLLMATFYAKFSYYKDHVQHHIFAAISYI